MRVPALGVWAHLPSPKGHTRRGSEWVGWLSCEARDDNVNVRVETDWEWSFGSMRDGRRKEVEGSISGRGSGPTPTPPQPLAD